jgi:hypothetical protein
MVMLERFGFAYGCAATVVAVILYAGAWFGRLVIPESNQIAMFALMTHAVAFTGQSRGMRPRPEPVVRVTPGRVRIARIALGLGAGVFALHTLGWVAVSQGSDDARVLWHANMTLAAMYLASSAVIAASFGVTIQSVRAGR